MQPAIFDGYRLGVVSADELFITDVSNALPWSRKNHPLGRIRILVRAPLPI